MYWFKHKIWQIKNVIKWLPIIWNQFDFDFTYAIEVFKFQLQKTSDYLNSDSAMTLSAKDNHKKIETIIRLMNKVYAEDYGMEYLDELDKKYGKDLFKNHFIKCDDKKGYSQLKYSYELTESDEKIREIDEFKNKKIIESNNKQKKAHKLLWNLIEHNIQKFWD